MDEKFKILVVDDDPGILKTISFLLEDYGYQIDTAENGYEAIEKVKKQKYNLALVDIMMPGMDGISAVHEIRKLSPGIIIIMMTAYVETQEEFQKLMDDGVLTIFRKPIDIPRLMMMIESLERKEFPLILIVDDRVEDRTVMRNLLEEKGFRIITAANGEEALACIDKYKEEIDIVLLDLILAGGETGIDVLEKIRNINPGIKTIIVTGYALEDMIQEAINKGAYAYLYKPLDIEIALSIIKDLLVQRKN